jgi:hypothetical protein
MSASSSAGGGDFGDDRHNRVATIRPVMPKITGQTCLIIERLRSRSRLKQIWPVILIHSETGPLGRKTYRKTDRSAASRGAINGRFCRHLAEVVLCGGRAGAIENRTEVTPDASVRDSAPRGQEVPFNLKQVAAEQPRGGPSPNSAHNYAWSARVPLDPFVANWINLIQLTPNKTSGSTGGPIPCVRRGRVSAIAMREWLC